MSRAVALAFLALATPALAAGAKFVTIPSADAKAPPSGLELRVVAYDGSTNGELTVEVRNPTATEADFAPAGLYFVPAVNPDQAPQRLGAVGSFQIKQEQKWLRSENLKVAPGATVRARLDVYCIDSHRGSPTSETPFRLAKTRVPTNLTTAIVNDARRASAGYGGMAAPRAKSAVQGEVWKNRDAKWIRLDGEGAQEANK